MAKRRAVVAYRVTWERMPENDMIVAETSSAKARSAAMRHVKGAGWVPLFFEMNARRAKEFDCWAAQQPQERIGWPVIEDTAKSERKAIVEAMERKSGCPGYEE